MKRNIFIAAVIMITIITACHSPKKASTDKVAETDSAMVKQQLQEQLAGTWQLNYISGIRIAFEGLYKNRIPFIRFDLANDHVSGNNSCNSYGAKIKMQNNSIQFSEFLQTMMACEGEGESTFNKMMQQVNKFEVTGDTLTFFKDDVAVMRFKRQ